MTNPDQYQKEKDKQQNETPEKRAARLRKAAEENYKSKAKKEVAKMSGLTEDQKKKKVEDIVKKKMEDYKPTPAGSSKSAAAAPDPGAAARQKRHQLREHIRDRTDLSPLAQDIFKNPQLWFEARTMTPELSAATHQLMMALADERRFIDGVEVPKRTAEETIQHWTGIKALLLEWDNVMAQAAASQAAAPRPRPPPQPAAPTEPASTSHGSHHQHSSGGHHSHGGSRHSRDKGKGKEKASSSSSTRKSRTKRGRPGHSYYHDCGETKDDKKKRQIHRDNAKKIVQKSKLGSAASKLISDLAHDEGAWSACPEKDLRALMKFLVSDSLRKYLYALPEWYPHMAEAREEVNKYRAKFGCQPYSETSGAGAGGGTADLPDDDDDDDDDDDGMVDFPDDDNHDNDDDGDVNMAGAGETFANLSLQPQSSGSRDNNPGGPSGSRLTTYQDKNAGKVYRVDPAAMNEPFPRMVDVSKKLPVSGYYLDCKETTEQKAARSSIRKKVKSHVEHKHGLTKAAVKLFTELAHKEGAWAACPDADRRALMAYLASDKIRPHLYSVPEWFAFMPDARDAVNDYRARFGCPAMPGPDEMMLDGGGDPDAPAGFNQNLARARFARQQQQQQQPGTAAAGYPAPPGNSRHDPMDLD